MYDIFNFIFNNAFLLIVVAALIYVYTKYKKIKSCQNEIQDKFKERLYPYLDKKYKEYDQIIRDLLDEYYIEEIQIELKKILKIIEPGIGGTLNDYVSVSNQINKLKLNSKLDLKRFPKLEQINKFETFTESEMESVDNGLAFARKEYNTLAFRYNELAIEFPMQYLTSILKLTRQFILFDAPKTNTYDTNFEVFEEEEPEIDSLAGLNKQLMKRENTLIEEDELPKKKEEVTIEHTDVILKPTINLDELNKKE